MFRYALFDCCLFLQTRLYDGRFHFQVKLRKRVKIKLKAFALFFMVRSYELFCHRTTWYTSCSKYTVLLFNVNKFKVNILDETDDISLGCIADVFSIHLQDLVIGKEFLVGRSVCKSSWRTQNQQRTRESLLNLVRSKGQVQLQKSKNISRVNFGLPSLQIFAQKTQSNDLQDSSINPSKWLNNAQQMKCDDGHHMHLLMELHVAICVEIFSSGSRVYCSCQGICLDYV